MRFYGGIGVGLMIASAVFFLGKNHPVFDDKKAGGGSEQVSEMRELLKAHLVISESRLSTLDVYKYVDGCINMVDKTVECNETIDLFEQIIEGSYKIENVKEENNLFLREVKK
tara:strand:- start:3979 stop:4317 length:339 start_codon:yes stop_codon:yes gene_type:complete